jgi:tetratricopeptide (TPR) repeat protein
MCAWRLRDEISSTGYYQGEQIMTDQDRLQKNARCDILMKEGIEGRQDKDAVDRTLSLTELAVELGRKDGLACALAWQEVLERRGIRDELAIVLDFSRANAIAGNRYGTKWQWEQPTLAREIFYLRRAVSHPKFNQVSDSGRCMILNNLGNRLRVAGRLMESLEYWRRALEVQPNFGMALCNQALNLANYAEALDDSGKQTLFLWVAHKEASAALAWTAVYTDPRDKRTWEAVRKLKDWIESVIDVEAMAALNPLT